MIKLCTKIEISTFTYYEDIKATKNINWGGLEVGVTQGYRQHSHSIKHIITITV